MKKYKAKIRFITSNPDLIEEVEVEKETPSSVWLKGRAGSVRKVTKYEQYFDTYEEAYSKVKYLVSKKIDEGIVRINRLQEIYLKLESDFKTHQERQG